MGIDHGNGDMAMREKWGHNCRDKFAFSSLSADVLSLSRSLSNDLSLSIAVYLSHTR